MTIFAPKPKPILRWSRVLHAGLAFVVTGYGAHLWGDTGCAIAAAGSILGGFAWELSNRLWPSGRAHPFGDLIDFLAFVAGALAAGIGYVVI